jgi:hypothetical protein
MAITVSSVIFWPTITIYNAHGGANLGVDMGAYPQTNRKSYIPAISSNLLNTKCPPFLATNIKAFA